MHNFDGKMLVVKTYYIYCIIHKAHTAFLIRLIYSTLREKCPNNKFFWFVFSRIWTEYGEIRSISSNTERHGVSLRIQSKGGKIRTRKTPYLDTFHAVTISLDHNISSSYGNS